MPGGSAGSGAAGAGATSGAGGTTAGSSGVSGSGGSGGAAGGNGGTALGGSAGNGGASGNGGTAGTSASACPSTAPGNGNLCPDFVGRTCYYDDCGGRGRIKAMCATTIPNVGNPIQQWSIETFPCGVDAECADSGVDPCPVGKVCLTLEGGALITECVDHTCGTGPIECDCVTGCFGVCTPNTMDGAITYRCNTCSDPRGCP